ncbi:prepilin peptidase [Zhihengliuella halotolerans]|uniref:prepilin peptidase n=1 Tax=Zhihengliuella halotolerans TaxID=370736 RepID=UPI000C7FA64F|nr:A24 family peptidase [Zhihengliuella halotolerans]
MVSVFSAYASSILSLWLLALVVVVFVFLGTRLAIIDARTHRLPNRIVGPWYLVAAALMGSAALFAGQGSDAWRMLAGGAILFGVYLVLHLIQPKGMGMGDVKLAGVLGMHLGLASWQHLLLGTFASFLLGGLYAMVLVLTKKANLKSSIPFGPFMIVGTAAALLVG